MRPVFLLLALAAVLAGCAASKPDSTPSGAKPSGVRFAETDLGLGGPEPVLHVAPNGDIMVAAQDPGGGGPRFWSSKNGGASFALTRPTTEGGGEVDMAPGASGVVYLSQLGSRGNLVSVSTDSGSTWRTAPLGTTTQYFDREWLLADASGAGYAVARQFGTTAASAASRTDDAGLTWVPQGRPWDSVHEPGIANGNLVAWNGGIAMAYACRDGGAVCVAKSADRAASWSQVLVALRPAGVANVYPAIAASEQGLLLAWSEPTDGRLAVFAAGSRDGVSWSAPSRVSGPAESATLAFPAARGDGAWVVYLATPVALGDSGADAAAAAKWTPMAVLVSAADGHATGPPVALRGAASHVGPISPPVGQTGAVARDRRMGDFFTADLDLAGRLVVAYAVDATGGDVRDVVARQS